MDFWRNKNLLWELTKKDMKEKYIESYLGILWAFIQPTITVLIFWFVFEIGFKSMPMGNVPFILWFICAIFPWNFFNDSLNNATSSIIANSYLVKKIVFRVSLLPLIQILSAGIIHVFFIAVTFIMFSLYGFYPNVYMLQVVYFLFASICLAFGCSLITSTLVIFLKDIQHLVMMILQFGFWMTPIFWNLTLIPEKYRLIFTLNPMYYITEGYRNSFIYHKWFWEMGYLNIYFWVFTIALILAGLHLFKKLRPHFADII